MASSSKGIIQWIWTLMLRVTPVGSSKSIDGDDETPDGAVSDGDTPGETRVVDADDRELKGTDQTAWHAEVVIQHITNRTCPGGHGTNAKSRNTSDGASHDPRPSVSGKVKGDYQRLHEQRVHAEKPRIWTDSRSTGTSGNDGLAKE
ncbi:hypothetical protein FA13DRAFT_1722924 [Coprinellus micaceus]|uniref:Hypervirulence associated protein TUDOR domain-containing protein n=1 Tax=Coprinellus micaceus TaxID=71717 RepID=A0A4Y7RDJ5_COPMI|nr:hypothetical protein FA13DRAFT_1722924 [Coprinellus micaceus]